MTDEDFILVCNMWKNISEALNCECISPYKLKYKDKCITVPAFFPHFGSENGMCLFWLEYSKEGDEAYRQQRQISDDLKIWGSWIPMEGMLIQGFDLQEDLADYEQMFREAGYFGPNNKIPPFVRRD